MNFTSLFGTNNGLMDNRQPYVPNGFGLLNNNQTGINFANRLGSIGNVQLGQGTDQSAAFRASLNSIGNQDPNLRLGMNMPTLQLALGGLQSLGGMWGAYNSNKLAKQQMGQSERFANINLANATKAYNTKLESIGRARAAFEGQSKEEADAFLKNNRL